MLSGTSNKMIHYNSILASLSVCLWLWSVKGAIGFFVACKANISAIPGGDSMLGILFIFWDKTPRCIKDKKEG